MQFGAFSVACTILAFAKLPIESCIMSAHKPLTVVPTLWFVFVHSCPSIEQMNVQVLWFNVPRVASVRFKKWQLKVDFLEKSGKLEFVQF